MKINRFIVEIRRKGNIVVILPIFLLLIVITTIGYFYWQSQNRNIPYTNTVSPSITSIITPKNEPSIQNGWKLFSQDTSYNRVGSPKSYKFIYPDNWELTTTMGVIKTLKIIVNGKHIGDLWINPGGHGGENNIVKIIRDTNEDYPAGQVGITELLISNNNITGTFWFMGKPNNAPLQPVFGFEFRYSNDYYKYLLPIFSQILQSVELIY